MKLNDFFFFKLSNLILCFMRTEKRVKYESLYDNIVIHGFT